MNLLAALWLAQVSPDPEVIIVTARGQSAEIEDAVLSTVTLDRERLARSSTERFEDIIADVPALQQFRRADSRSVHPTAQGLSTRGLGGNAAGRVLVILDGVPQSDPFGGWPATSALIPNRLSMLRVSQGGGDVRWGPGALSGTVEASSYFPREPLTVAGSGSIGSHNSLDLRSSLGTQVGTGNLSLSVAHARGDGFVPVIDDDRGPADRRASYRQSSGQARVRLPVAGLTADVGLDLFDDRRERGTAFSDNRNRGATASLRITPGTGDGWSLVAYHQRRRFSSQFASVSPGRVQANLVADQYAVPSHGSGLRGEWIAWRDGHNSLRIIGDVRRVEGETREHSSFVGGEPTRERRAGGNALIAGAGAEATGRSGALTWTLGGRLDHWRLGDGQLRERLIDGVELTNNRFDDRSGWQPTARAGLAWQARPDLSLRAAAYRGWRLPTLNELYRPFRVGGDATAANAALKPETLIGVEAGLDWVPSPAFSASLTGYAAQLDNAIMNVDLGRGPGQFPGVGFVPAGGIFRQRLNVEHIRSRGVELSAQVKDRRWLGQLSVAYSDPEVSASGAAAPLDGRRPAQIAKLRAMAALTYFGDGWQWNIAANRGSGQFDDDSNLDALGTSFALNSEATVRLGRRMRLGARVENLTNRKNLTGVNSDGSRERSLPRTFWLSLSMANDN